MADSAGIWGCIGLEEQARRQLDQAVFDYCAGGAGDEQCLRENLAAFAKRRMIGRLSRSTESLSTKTTVLGQEISVPIMIAPVSLQRMISPLGESASARAAEAFGTVMCLSMNGSCSPEEVAQAAPSARRWMQLYILRNWAVTESVLSRAEASGYEAIVVTVDVPVVGLRHRDLRNSFSRLDAGEPSLLKDPAFVSAIADEPVQAAYDALFPNPDVRWDDIRRLQELTKLPIVVKGILSPDDAQRALDAGATALIVSNHGGRQFDRLPATIDVLASIVDAVPKGTELYLDSGVRRGADVLVALALGARAVLVGRALLWGVAVGGQEGATRVLQALTSELRSAMTLLGVVSARSVDATILWNQQPLT